MAKTKAGTKGGGAKGTKATARPARVAYTRGLADMTVVTTTRPRPQGPVQRVVQRFTNEPPDAPHLVNSVDAQIKDGIFDIRKMDGTLVGYIIAWPVDGEGYRWEDWYYNDSVVPSLEELKFNNFKALNSTNINDTIDAARTAGYYWIQSLCWPPVTSY